MTRATVEEVWIWTPTNDEMRRTTAYPNNFRYQFDPRRTLSPGFILSFREEIPVSICDCPCMAYNTPIGCFPKSIIFGTQTHLGRARWWIPLIKLWSNLGHAAQRPLVSHHFDRSMSRQQPPWRFPMVAGVSSLTYPTPSLMRPHLRALFGYLMLFVTWSDDRISHAAVFPN